MTRWFTLCLVLGFFLLITFSASGHAASDFIPFAEQPDKGQLTKQQLKDVILELSKATFEEEYIKATNKLKSLAPVSIVQEMLGDLYPEVNEKEKIRILFLLDRIGVEGAFRALLHFAADFAVARPKHPNDMSFASFYVLEKFQLLARKKLPREKDKQEKKGDAKGGPVPKKIDPNLPTLATPDGLIHTGTYKDRAAIIKIITDKKLYVYGEKMKDYPIPVAMDTDWIRIIGSHAFVTVRGQSSGVDLLFINRNGQWSLQAHMGRWAN